MSIDQHTTIIDQPTLTGIVGFVWETLLHEELDTCEPCPIADSISATISIGGPWTATLEVTMTTTLARRFAADLLGMDGASLDPDDINDAIGELANVVGGNVKGLLDSDEATTLSLPVVSHAPTSITGGQLTASCGFSAAGDPMTWALYERP